MAAAINALREQQRLEARWIRCPKCYEPYAECPGCKRDDPCSLPPRLCGCGKCRVEPERGLLRRICGDVLLHNILPLLDTKYELLDCLDEARLAARDDTILDAVLNFAVGTSRTNIQVTLEHLPAMMPKIALFSRCVMDRRIPYSPSIEPAPSSPIFMEATTDFEEGSSLDDLWREGTILDDGCAAHVAFGGRPHSIFVEWELFGQPSQNVCVFDLKAQLKRVGTELCIGDRQWSLWQLANFSIRFRIYDLKRLCTIEI